MELRRVKEGKSALEFPASAAGEVIAKAVNEPEYVGILRVRQEQEFLGFDTLELYDYYGDSTNATYCFSYVALVDAVDFRAERQVPLGSSALDEVYSRVVPGFLVNKEPKPYGYGDWLSWELESFRLPSRPSRILGCRWKATPSLEPWASFCSRPSSCSRSCSS